MTAMSEMAQGPFSSNYIRTVQPSISTPKNTKLDSLIDLARHLCESTVALTRVPVPTQVPAIPVHKILAMMSDNDAYSNLDVVLSNQEIQQFLRHSITIENLPHYCTVVGYFATKLIQNTHYDGINEFTFDMHGIKPISQFGESLEKEHGRKLEFIIYGELGNDAMYRATCNAIVERASGIFAEYALGEFCVWKLYDQGYTQQPNSPFWTQYNSPDEETNLKYSQHSVSKKYRYTRKAVYYPRTIIDMHSPFVGPVVGYYSTRSAIKFFKSLGVTQDPMTELTNSEFIDHWKPAVKHFKKMKELFGGRQ